MLELILFVCYQYKTFVNIDIIGLNFLLTDLKCIKVAVYFWVADYFELR